MLFSFYLLPFNFGIHIFCLYSSLNLNYFFIYPLLPSSTHTVPQPRLLLLSQLGLRAYDNLRPGQVATANLTISVNRNPSAPTFNNLVYTERIAETFTLGVEILRVQASDFDGVSKSKIPAGLLFLIHCYLAQLSVS